LISTYFLYHHGYCPSTEAILFDRPLVTRWASELAAGLGRHPAVLFLELDAIGSSACMRGTRLDAWLTNLRIEVRKLTALPQPGRPRPRPAADNEPRLRAGRPVPVDGHAGPQCRTLRARVRAARNVRRPLGAVAVGQRQRPARARIPEPPLLKPPDRVPLPWL